jgi:HD-GYP domain-containing protein (c-di-GMP phosphodiesterase class II)
MNIDAEGIERLLSHLSGLLDISIDIKNPYGDSLLGSCDTSRGLHCHKMESAPRTCSADMHTLFKKLATTRSRMAQIERDNIHITGYPLYCNKEVVGMLCSCWSADIRRLHHSPEALLEEIANRISFEIQAQFETDNLTKELSHRYEELHLIYEIGKKLGNIDSINDAVTLIAEHAQDAIESDVLIVSLPGRNIHEILYHSPSSVPFEINDTCVLKIINELITKKLASAHTYPVHIFSEELCNHRFPVHFRNVSLEIMAAPIKVKTIMEGIIYFINIGKDNAFETGDMSLINSLAEQMSLLMTNKELYDNLKDFLLDVIKALVHTIEAKDSYTRGHSERVSTIAMMIAEGMGFSEEEKETLTWASMLHDIGKIGVPGKVLKKAGKLTQEEFSYIRDHPGKGYSILQPIHQLNGSLEAILHHHEKYDGTGYPSGLQGSEIPVISRIIAVADAYDAMTSARSYRPKISHEEAVAELERVKGTQLDPEIVSIFVNLV